MSQRVCAKSLEFVVGRSIRIASEAMVLFVFADPIPWRITAFWQDSGMTRVPFPPDPKESGFSRTALKCGLLILIVPASCSGLRCFHFYPNLKFSRGPQTPILPNEF